MGSSCNSVWGMLPNFTKPIYSQAPFSNCILTYWLFAIYIWPLLFSKIVFFKVTCDFLITKFHVYFSSVFILNPLEAMGAAYHLLEISFYLGDSEFFKFPSDVSGCFSTDFSFLYLLGLGSHRDSAFIPLLSFHGDSVHHVPMKTLEPLCSFNFGINIRSISFPHHFFSDLQTW